MAMSSTAGLNFKATQPRVISDFSEVDLLYILYNFVEGSRVVLFFVVHFLVDCFALYIFMYGIIEVITLNVQLQLYQAQE
jgi:hypothetical protein